MKKNIVLPFLLICLQWTAQSQLTGDTLTGVRLSSFHASKQNNLVSLNWKVACRLSYAQFEVQRSVNGIDFITIHSFQADYLRCQLPFDYSEPAPSGQAFYRIKVGDIDGKFSTEKVVKVSGREIEETDIKIISPVTGNYLQLTVEAASTNPVSVQLVNSSGVIQQQISLSPSKGITRVEIPIWNMPGGTYFLNYQTAGKNKSIQFIK